MPHIVKPSLAQIASGLHRQHPRYRGVVGHWMFGEGTGTTVYDLSGYGRHGTLGGTTGTPTWVMGQWGPALEFVNANQQRVDISYTALKNLPPTHNWAFSLWAYATVYTTALAVIVWEGADDLIFYPYHTVNGNGVFFFWRDLGGGIFDENGATRLGWNHFVFVDYAPDDHRLFINGAQAFSSANTGATGPFAGNLWIGSRSEDLTQSYQGRIDDVRIYDRALSPSEVMSIYNDPFAEFRERRRQRYAPQEAISGNIAPLLMQMKRRRAA